MKFVTLLALLLAMGLGVATTPHPLPASAQDPTTTPTPTPPLPDGYQLVFEDEFEQVGLDPDHWQYRYPDGRPYGVGVAAHEAVQQPGDGFLYLVTSVQDGAFWTGMIRSVAEFRYGYFEARIQFQRLQGHHGAFWLQSVTYDQYLDDPARSGAEIDIIEFFGEGRTAEDAQHNVYWNPYASPDLERRQQELFYRDQYDAELSQDFHTFGLLWTPDGYVFYIDGVETWRLEEGVSQVPQYMVLSLATSAWENPVLDIEALPDALRVDYVRVYQP